MKREPLTEPKQDSPTNTGMTHAIGPRCLFPKSCAATNAFTAAAKEDDVAKDASTHHGHGLRGDDGLGAQRGEVGQVGQDVHGRHDGQGDDDGARKVPAGGWRNAQAQTPRQRKKNQAKADSLVRLDHLLRHQIQVVPVDMETEVYNTHTRARARR